MGAGQTCLAAQNRLSSHLIDLSWDSLLFNLLQAPTQHDLGVAIGARTPVDGEYCHFFLPQIMSSFLAKELFFLKIHNKLGKIIYKFETWVQGLY
jgi:hypothetical protein